MHTATNDTVYACNNLEVGNIGNGFTPVAPTTGKILRISATLTPPGGPGVGWEDGNMGNSTELWFTMCDFKCVEHASGLAAGIPSFSTIMGPRTAVFNEVISYGSTSHLGIIPGNTSGGAAGTGAQLIAEKIIPKGFQIADEIAFYFANLPTPANWTNVFAMERNLITGAINSISGLGPTVPTGFDNPLIFTPMSGGIGDGRTTLVVVAYASPTTNTSNEAFLSVRATMTRL